MPATGVPLGADHAARRDRLRARLDELEAVALLVTRPVNVRWLSGFTGSNGLLLVARDDDVLLTDARYAGRAPREVGDLRVEVDRDALLTELGDLPDGGLALEADDVTWSMVARFERALDRPLVSTAGVVEALRAHKDAGEVARIAAACALTTEALTWLVDTHGLAGHAERALAVALERRFVDLGADGVAFPSIVASGPNGAVPHHDPGTRVVASGDLVTLDCGALVDGYHADCTRTFAVGEPDARLVEVYEVVERAQAAGRAAVRAGVAAEDVDRAARDVARDAGYEAHYAHPTGHGVGLEIHEAPAVAPGSTATIHVGAVLTVEPGLYLPGIGGVRIEDTLVVDPDGTGRVLTELPRELRVV